MLARHIAPLGWAACHRRRADRHLVACARLTRRASAEQDAKMSAFGDNQMPRAMPGHSHGLALRWPRTDVWGSKVEEGLTRGEGLAELVGLLCVVDAESVEVARAPDLELGAHSSLLDLDGCARARARATKRSSQSP